MKSVSEAVARLREIEASAPRSDGVVCFARLYREVTEGVAAQLDAHTFQNNAFVEALDLGFAGLFFAAYAAFARDPSDDAACLAAALRAARAPRTSRRSSSRVAGMNAHINRDLPVALVDTCRALGLDLRDGSPEHADYLRVNALLAKVEARVKQSYLTGWTKLADRLLHRAGHVDDVVAMWDVDACARRRLDERHGALAPARRARARRAVPADARPDGRPRRPRAARAAALGARPPAAPRSAKPSWPRSASPPPACPAPSAR